MRALILGSTGMVGTALVTEAERRGLEVTGAARSGTDVSVDVRDAERLRDAVVRAAPTLIVNSAAVVDIAACEADPGLAYEVNARPAAILAELSRDLGAKLVQISTDHYFTGDGRALHSEDAPVQLVNEYARSKFAAEGFALTDPAALVVRTNVTGFRGHGGRTFAEWVLRGLEAGEPMTLFDDFICSTMFNAHLAEAVFDLAERDATGVLNLASSEISSKKEFTEAVAQAGGYQMPAVQVASVKGLSPARAESAGLDVTRAEGVLQRRLPTLSDTATALVRDYAGRRTGDDRKRP